MIKDTFHFNSPDKSPTHFIDLFSDSMSRP